MSRCVQCRALRTFTTVASRCVDARAAHTDILAGTQTLVHIFADAGVRVVPVACWARALVAAWSISTQAIFA